MIKTQRTVDEAKEMAKRYIKRNKKDIRIVSFLRTITTVCMVITIWSLMDSLAFDARLSDYNAQTTNTTEYALVLVNLWLCRVLGDYFLDIVIYPDELIMPHARYKGLNMKLNLYIAMRIGFYVTLPIIGLWLATMSGVAKPIWYGWVVIIFMTYINARYFTFGVRSAWFKVKNIREAIKVTRPKTPSDWKSLFAFQLQFLGHDILNCLTFGLYGYWLIPYKKATERFILEKF